MALLDTYLQREIKPGAYQTKIHYYKEIVPANKNKQPYVLVQMNIDGIEVTDRWYSSRIPYIMNCLRKQLRADYLDYTLSQLLKQLSKYPFTVHIYYDGYYGRQIDYNEYR
jgi:hypothetical protein